MRILILGPWAVARARHGGQIRAASIIDAYTERGHDVMFMGVYDPTNVPLADTGLHDVPIDSTVMAYIGQSGKPWEISLWQAFADVPASYSVFETAVRKFRPDVVQFEEPYLWPVVKMLRDRGELAQARLVHSSYNFETVYRRVLARISGNTNREILEHVANQEIEIARECDLVLTVSDDDANSFRSLGTRHVVVARNGSRRIEPTQQALAAVDAYLGDAGFALFVSSAHPPNAEGLLEFTKAMRDRLPGKLVICGAVYKLLDSAQKTHRIIQDAEIMGMVGPDVLAALLARASVILLPKTSGGGSNLKTSEALLANRPVVASSLAFAGFEGWRALSGVEIADEPSLFWQSVTRKLASSPASYSTQLDARREELLWSACLAPMIDSVEKVVAGSCNSRRRSRDADLELHG